jgi:leader peptidase (prepilin peptidase) / N-methyltransferase
MIAMFEALGQTPALGVAFTALFGLLIGSFLNVVIYRVPKMMEHAWAAEAAELRGEVVPTPAAFNLVTPRSSCPHCGHAIRAWENIPILSWLILRGKCSSCSAPISARYPIIEASTALLSAAAVGYLGFNWVGLAAVVFSMILLTLAMIDVDTQLLPDSMTLPLLWLGLAVNLFGLFTPLRDAVIGAMFGYLLLWSVYWLFKLVTGKEGMGYGDFKLLAALGAWFGWQSIPAIILLSSIVGAVIGIALIVLAKRGRETPMPFGPYLAGAGLLMLYLREPINTMLLRIS